MAERLSNIKLGDMLGLSHASVSRIRSGDRLPSLTVMMEIAKLTKWSLDDQAIAREDGTYAEKFDDAFENAELVPAQRVE